MGVCRSKGEESWVSAMHDEMLVVQHTWSHMEQLGQSVVIIETSRQGGERVGEVVAVVQHTCSIIRAFGWGS